MLLRNHFVKLRGVVFQSMLFDIFNSDFYDTFTERHLDHVADLYVIGSLGVLSVHLYMFGIAGIVGNGSSFDDSGNL